MSFKLVALPFVLSSLISLCAVAATQQENLSTTNRANDKIQQYFTLNNDVSASQVDLNWLSNIKLGGYLAIDSFAQTNEWYHGPQDKPDNSQSAVTIGAAALNVAAQVNSWVTADINLFAAGGTQPSGINGAGKSSSYPPNTRYYPGDVNAFSSNDTSPKVGAISIDEAFVDIANFNERSFALRGGQFYLPFGQYDRYAIMPTLVQQFVEIRETALEASYLANDGLHTSIYGFRGLPKQSSEGLARDHLNNGGASLGYTAALNSHLSIDTGLDYLYNDLDTAYFVSSITSSYSHHSSAWDGYLTAISGPFTLGMQYVVSQSLDSTAVGSSQKPSVGTVIGAYSFNVNNHLSKASLSYGWSDQAIVSSGSGATAGFAALPAHRIAAEYNMNVLKNTMVGLEVNYDTAYSVADGGTGHNCLTGIARLAVSL